MLIVGVAESVSELIAEHESIERALVQVQMPRMSGEELGEILDKGMAKLNMKISDDAKNEIVRLSCGLPHYTHSLGLHATRFTIEDDRETVSKSDVDNAIGSALGEINLSLRSAYDKATFSPSKETIYAQVLMACALAKAGDFGYFTPSSVREPLSAIRGKSYRIPGFAKHLTRFSTLERGRVLQKEGARRRYRYRFSNPLMQPFVVMKGVASCHITEETLKRFGS